LGKFIPKNTNFGNLGAVSLHFKSDNGEIWHEGANWDSLPMPNFVKSLKGIYPFWANLYEKNTNFGNLKPPFLKSQRLNLAL